TPPNLATGLVGHWTFDGKDMIGNVRDSSGQGNTGYMVAAATSSQQVAGTLGQALKFTTNTLQYVSASSLATPTSAGSVSMWIQPSQTINSSSAGFINPWQSSNARDGILFNNNNCGGGAGQLNFIITPSGGNYSCAETTITSWKAGTWYHIVATWNGTNQKVYVNGTLNVSVSQTQTMTAGTGQRIGGDGVFSTRTFPGSIDDVRVYNRALSAAEVLQLYNLGR
ncbi:MAG: LamG domain-containing protein, partial [bacterium]|nr:LamG domain-containing protein [bacterium]